MILFIFLVYSWGSLYLFRNWKIYGSGCVEFSRSMIKVESGSKAMKSTKRFFSFVSWVRQLMQMKSLSSWWDWVM